MLSSLALVLLPDQLLAAWVAMYGVWAVAFVCLLIFAETGLVIAPFLPGDSLLFLAGTVFAAAGINIHGAVLALVVAAIAGDAVNYTVGRHAAPWVVARFGGRWLRPSHLEATHRYFERHGAATIVIARFVPLVRTLAPFVAGAGRMPIGRFAVFNVLGACAWVGGFVYAGAWLGAQPVVRDHIGAFSLGVVLLSLTPVAWAGLRARLAARRASKTPNADWRDS